MHVGFLLQAERIQILTAASFSDVFAVHSSTNSWCTHSRRKRDGIEVVRRARHCIGACSRTIESPLSYAALQALRCFEKACRHVMFCWHTVAVVAQFSDAAVAAEKKKIIGTAKARTANETGVMIYAGLTNTEGFQLLLISTVAIAPSMVASQIN